jgi:hypothetical protein
VACTLALSLPGVHAVRADEATPDASVGDPAPPSFEGFADHLARKGEPAAPVEGAGPTCNAQSPMAAEMAHQQRVARMQAQLIAEMRARAAAAEAAGEAMPEVVVLNGSGYNYRSPMQGGPSAPPQAAPAP